MTNYDAETFDNSNPAGQRVVVTVEEVAAPLSMDTRVSLAPLDPETALRALLQTPSDGH